MAALGKPKQPLNAYFLFLKSKQAEINQEGSVKVTIFVIFFNCFMC